LLVRGSRRPILSLADGSPGTKENGILSFERIPLCFDLLVVFGVTYPTECRQSHRGS
jgi:hypothetical protein